MGRIDLVKTGMGSQTIGGVIKNSSLGNNAVTINAGKLILNGANEYLGTTTVNAGVLQVDGTGVSPITVNAGTLKGNGSTSAAIAVGTGSGTGAVMAPGDSIGTFTTTGALTLNSDAAYQLQYNSGAVAFDKLVVHGLTISNAILSMIETGNPDTLPVGTSITIVNNTDSLPVTGNFYNLAEGSTINNGVSLFKISYVGGTGNDVVLTVLDNVPPSVPQALTATKTADGRVQLLWQPSTDNVGVTGYYVFCNGVQLNADAVATPGYITSAPAGSSVNVYTVIATDAVGNLSGESPIETFTNSNSFNGPSGVMDVVKIFPNPNDGNFKVRVNTKETGNILIAIYNAGGSVLQTIQDVKQGDVYQKDVRLCNVTSGTYYVKITVGAFNSIKTVIIQ